MSTHESESKSAAIAPVPLRTAAGIAIAEFKRIAAERQGIPVDLVFTRTNRIKVVDARNEVWAEMRTALRMSYPQIGRVSGGWDHSTVMHGIRKHLGVSR